MRKGQTSLEYLLLIVIVVIVLAAALVFLQGSSDELEEVNTENFNCMMCTMDPGFLEDNCDNCTNICGVVCV
jgi:uncharacterized protein (UPF0333 family)